MTAVDPKVQELIDRLRLEPHPEGGWYRETWRSPVVLEADALPGGYPGARAAMTCIYFLLPSGARSALHRVRSEELWLHHQGDVVALGIGPTREVADSVAGRVLLGQGGGSDDGTNEVLQAIVPPGEWQKAEALPGPAGYALVACVVSPGFEFEDFEMA